MSLPPPPPPSPPPPPPATTIVRRTPAADEARSERMLAALSHLGVPLWSAMTPALLFYLGNPSGFRRRHASAAFSFQIVFFACWAVFVPAVIVFAVVEPEVMPIVLGVVFLLQLPNVMLALAGREPIRMVPVWILNPYR